MSRRGLLLSVAASGAIVAIGGAGGAVYWRRHRWQELPTDPAFFLRIGVDDTVTVISKHLEMGQGIMTGLSMLVAEELDADWSQMRAEQAPADRKKYFNGQWGRQETAASSGMSNSWMQMRLVGAAARAMLIAAAADEWRVAPSEIGIENGRISHRPSSRAAGFGTFAEAAMRRKVPAKEQLTLKPTSEWRLIGKSLPRLDTREKTNGSAQFALDIRRPGMVRAVVLRAPRFGGKIKSFDATQALAVPGVLEVVEIPSGVAVLAENTWAALRGREELVADWDESGAETRSSRDILADYRAMSETRGVVARDHGDIGAALSDADRTLDFEFSFPYLAHAPMEPLSCVMERTSRGVTIWAGCQAHTLEQRAVAKVLGLRTDQVTINTTYAGASFGRRTFPLTDWIPELAHIVRQSSLDRPVQLVWTREDDIRGGAYRPLAYHKGRAGLDAAGSISAWSHSIVCQSLVVGTPWSYRSARQGLDFATFGGMRHLPYAVSNHHLEVHSPTSPVTVGFWRSVGNSHNAFVLETVIDELAYMAGQDPLAFRLRNARDERKRNVLKEAGRLANWNSAMPQNSGRGVASFSESNRAGHTHLALVVEVAAVGKAIRIDRIFAVVDCGLAVNPALVKSQVEGSIGFALSTAVRNEILLQGGVVEQSNFHDYEPTRLSEMPEIEVRILESASSPKGVGEGAVAPLAPALGNAIFAATGLRARELPMRLETA